MLRFILQKLGMAIPTLLLISVMVFALIRLIPGDPALLMLGDMADPQSLADMRHTLGLGVVPDLARFLGLVAHQ